MTLTAVLEKAEEGGFTIYLKEFPGVISEGTARTICKQLGIDHREVQS